MAKATIYDPQLIMWNRLNIAEQALSRLTLAGAHIPPNLQNKLDDIETNICDLKDRCVISQKTK